MKHKLDNILKTIDVKLTQGIDSLVVSMPLTLLGFLYSLIFKKTNRNKDTSKNHIDLAQ